MSDASAQPPRGPGAFPQSVEMPRLVLPSFELRRPKLRLEREDGQARAREERTAAAAAWRSAAPLAPPDQLQVEHAAVVAHDPIPMPAPEAMPPVAPGIAEFAPLPYAPPVHAPIPAAMPSSSAPPAVDMSRIERLRSDAMLGLVVGIGVTIVAVATIVMLWSKLHGVAPGTF